MLAGQGHCLPPSWYEVPFLSPTRREDEAAVLDAATGEHRSASGDGRFRRCMDRSIGRFSRALAQHGYHVLFGVSLLSLTSLVAWWSIFIKTAIQQQRDAQYENLKARLTAEALILGHDHTKMPILGALDERLSVVRCGMPESSEFSQPLRPFWQDFCVAARSDYLTSIEKAYQRKRLMIIGESSVLIVVVLLSSFMLYRIIALERRTARELKEFFSRVTHEIKTPVTAIKAFLQTLRAQAIPGAQLLALVDLALKQVERQERLTENLLVGQRLNRDGFGMQLKSFELHGFVDDFLYSHRLMLSQADVEFADAGKGVVVVADPDGLRVILENLMDNAVKYGGTPLRLRIAIARADGRILLQFADNGVGFDPAKSEMIFEAYRRLANELPEGRHGTGMGLYLSRKLARTMGCDLFAESPGRGAGATFTLSLAAGKE